MGKIEIPKEIETFEVCKLCEERIYDNKPMKIRVDIGKNKLESYLVCDSCGEKKLNIDKERADFLRALQKFIHYNKINKDLKNWTKKAVKIFIKYLKQEKISIKDYGVYVARDWKSYPSKDFYLKDLMILYKLEEEEEVKEGDNALCPKCKNQMFWKCLGEPEGDFFSCENCNFECDKNMVELK